VTAAGTTDLVRSARDGDLRSVARLISLVEDGSAQIREITGQLSAGSGRAHVVGLTGAPGVGKSTTTTALISAWRERELRVGVLAVDPSSPFSGGALLGDRIRMQAHATDPGVFIRSMASRGQLGGLAAATPQALRVLDAAGFDVVVIETVGVGQSEVEIARTADSVVVVLAPGMGDAVQAAKAGILEIGDVYTVNKFDRDNARATLREIRHMLAMAPAPAPAPDLTAPTDQAAWRWTPTVIGTVASGGEGIPELVESLDAHRSWLTASGELLQRRSRRAAGEIEALVVAGLRHRLEAAGRRGTLDDRAREVARGRLDPYTAADQLIAELTHNQSQT
jgi:LAO/AO transport system kinase